MWRLFARVKLSKHWTACLYQSEYPLLFPGIFSGYFCEWPWVNYEHWVWEKVGLTTWQLIPTWALASFLPSCTILWFTVIADTLLPPGAFLNEITCLSGRIFHISLSKIRLLADDQTLFFIWSSNVSRKTV